MKFRVSFFIILFCTITLLILGRLYYLQIVNKEYKMTADRISSKQLIEYPIRGLIYDRNKNIVVANQIEYSLMVIPKDVKNIDTLLFCDLFHITKQEFISKLNKLNRYSPHKPSVFIQKINKVQFSKIKELLFNFSPFFIQKKYIREYPYKTASNVFGYIGEVSNYFLKQNNFYKKGDLIGIGGIEKSYEKKLRGKKGAKYIQVNKFNVRLKNIHTVPAVKGKDITSTVDINLQEYGEQLMQNKKGSIVAIEPSTGEILALVSAPTYDPNLLIGKDRNKNFTKLNNDSIGIPLFDKSILAEYPPGSPFKIVTGLIGLQEQVINTKTSFKCNYGFKYRKLHIKCLCGLYGKKIALEKAIYNSCNNYFCTVYKRTLEKYPTAEEGYKVWKNHVNSFNFGKFLNNDLPTGRKGFVPTSSYYNNTYGNNKWRAVYNISNAIGQGEILSTPIQLANLATIIANRGFYYIPHVVRSNEKKFTERKYTTVDSIYFKDVVEGMYKVIENGTARASRVRGLKICGKTGTAQNSHGQDHSIAMVFAPKDNPKIAVAVVVENGYWGSRWAAPISTLMIEKYLKGGTRRKYLEKRMLEGNLWNEYVNQFKQKDSLSVVN